MLKNKRSVILSSDELGLQFMINRNISNVEVETFTTKIMKNARFKKFTIVLMGMSLYFKDVFASTKGIDGLGWTLLGLVRDYAYWVLLLWCIVEVIKSGVGGESKKTLSIVMRFVIIFASMYLLPNLFNVIKEAF